VPQLGLQSSAARRIDAGSIGRSSQATPIECKAVTNRPFSLREWRDSLFVNAADPIIIKDLNGRVIDLNDEAERVYGWKRDELLGQPFTVTFPPELHEQIEELFRRCQKGEEIRNFKGVRRTKDNRVHPVLMTLTLLSDENGQPFGIATLTQTISKQKESLQEQEARLKSVFEAAVEAIIVLDEEGVIESLNASAERMFGYEPGELEGQNVSVLMPPPYRGEHDGYIRHYVETGEKKIIGIVREVEALRKDGTVFPIALSVSEVKMQRHRLFTGIVRDVTERKLLEKRLLQAERLSAIGEAMTALTHESRNALQRGQACLEMLKMVDEGNAEALDLIDGAQRAQDDLHRLYEEVRQYAAPQKIRRTCADVGLIVREAWACLSPRRNKRTASLSDHGNLDLHCEVDEFALRQVFQNIFDNALMACPDPVEITISYSESDGAAGRALRISIRDNGPGLSPEAKQRVFDPFFTTKTHGTGLGMAICQRSIQAHGGKITVGDGNGRGAEFVIDLPRAEK